MLTLFSVLLFSSHVLSVVQSKQCDERTEYLENNQCCKKCEPGNMMLKKCEQSLPNTSCDVCGNGYFASDYNINYRWCHLCRQCTKEHMKYEKNCTKTSDAKCTCEDGYRCSDNNCETCVKIKKTTASPPITTTPLTRGSNTEVCCHFSKYIMWILVSLCLACVCLCLLRRHAQPCGWIMSALSGVWIHAKSNYKPRQCTEEEKVPMPVQEMCGKTEKMEDV